jgi:hypothetical protein
VRLRFHGCRASLGSPEKDFRFPRLVGLKTPDSSSVECGGAAAGGDLLEHEGKRNAQKTNIVMLPAKLISG